MLAQGSVAAAVGEEEVKHDGDSGCDDKEEEEAAAAAAPKAEVEGEREGEVAHEAARGAGMRRAGRCSRRGAKKGSERTKGEKGSGKRKRDHAAAPVSCHPPRIRKKREQ